MNSRTESDWLADHRPVTAAPDPTHTDHVRASLVAHGIRRHRRRRHARFVACAGTLAVAGGIVVGVAGMGAAPQRAGARLAAQAHPAQSGMRLARTPLISLASDVRVMHAAPQSGDATLVVRHTLDGDQTFGGYDLYSDAGKYFYAPDSLTALQQQVDGDVVQFGNEAHELSVFAAGAGESPDAVREAVLAIYPVNDTPWTAAEVAHARTQEAQLLHRRLGPPATFRQYQDSVLWIMATRALAAGAGRPDVRAGAMKVLSTLAGVTQTQTSTDGTPALEVAFSNDGAPETIWLDANSGVPIEEQDDGASRTTFSVERVTAADLPTTLSASAQLR